MNIRRTGILLALIVPLLGSCTATAPPGRVLRGPSTSSGIELTLPASWWHETRLAEPLELTGEQFQKLDALRERQEEIARLERDTMMAMRELRSALEARNATATDIVAAGTHLRALRQTLLERQIEVLAAQREILSVEQWKTLQRALADDAGPQRMDGERRRGPTRGPGGRRPPGSW